MKVAGCLSEAIAEVEWQLPHQLNSNLHYEVLQPIAADVISVVSGMVCRRANNTSQIGFVRVPASFYLASPANRPRMFARAHAGECD